MAIVVPSATEVQAKYVSRASAAVTDYTKEVGKAGPAWQSGVDVAGPAWGSGVAAAQANGLYNKGTAGKSNLYVTNSVNLGGQRYPTGIQAGAAKFGTQIGKVLQIEANITLPPRGPVGSNMGRAQIVADTLHQAKLNGAFS